MCTLKKDNVLTDNTLGLIILAGGKSSRMGTDKTWLKWNGKTFFEHLWEKVKNIAFDEIFVSVNSNEEKFAAYPVQVIKDNFTECGPLAGIQACLSKGKMDFYLVLSIDMLLLPESFLKNWRNIYLTEKYQAIIPTDKNSDQPLAGIYHRSCLPVIEELLRNNSYRLHDLLDKVKTKRIIINEKNNFFFNVNTPAQLVIASAKTTNQKRRNPVVTIAAERSKTGKTTLITQLLPHLTQRGIRTAVVKSDGHNFTFDQAGTDTWKYMQAGAQSIAISAPEQYGILVHTKHKKDIYELSQEFSDVGLVLIETRSHGVFPVIEVFRSGHTNKIITPAELLVGIVTDDINTNLSAPVLIPTDNPSLLVDFIFDLIK